MDTLEIVNAISQAASNKEDGAREDNGKSNDFQEIGLRREEGQPIYDKRIMDGFNINFKGNKLKLSYQSEISLKEVYATKFEDEITDILEQCIKFIKKEYKSITKKSLGLKMIDEPIIRVEHMNKIRSWVVAYCWYEISGIDEVNDSGTSEDRLKKAEKDWVELTKKNYKK